MNVMINTIVLKAEDSHSIARVLTALRKGGIIAYPTETAYGIGCTLDNIKTVARIYRIKHRPKGKLLSVIVGSVAIAKQHVLIDDKARRLVKKFMPGPLTLVSPTKTKGSLAWRIPSHWFALELAKRFGKPIISTSANISGRQPPYKIGDVKRTFEGKIAVIIDGGNLPKRPTSTIFDVRRMKILRRGPISKSAILGALKRSR